MNSHQRIAAALKGHKPDRVPIFPIYDTGYLMTSAGKDPRDYITASGKERVESIERCFLRHPTDGYFVHTGCNDDWVNAHTVEKFKDYWMITEKATGRKYRLLPGGAEADEDGKPFRQDYSSDMFLHKGITGIESRDDIDRVIPPVPSEKEIDEIGRFAPLKHMAEMYPDQHFSFQISSPMPRAVNACGGYVDGLVTMAGDPCLFREIMERYTERMAALIAPGKKAGGRSIWFTSYYTGADTIAPRDFAEMVFPYEKEICRQAREQGLDVLYWFLGDLMPVLDKVMELPIDALVLEQGRKGYDTDPVAIRKKVGDRFCLFGYGYERDYCDFNREGLKTEFLRQLEGAGANGAFIAGTPIMPPDADPDAVDYYFEQAREISR